MSAAFIDPAVCDRSPRCPARRACPHAAIVPTAGDSAPGRLGYTVLEEKCTGCGVCADVCAGGAVRLN